MTYELEGRAAHPLSGLFQSADFPLADLIPSDALEAVFGGLYYTEARAYPSGDSSVFDVHVAFEGELAIEPAGDEGPAIVFGETDAGWTVMEVNTVIGPQSSFSFVDLPISLRIPKDVLRDVESDGPAMLTMLSTFTLSSDGGFTIDSDETLTLAESEVANSGVTVSAGGITWNFDRGQTLPEAIAAGITGEFIGIGFQDLIVKLPPDFVGFPTLSADYCCIGTGGVSGRFHGTFTPEFDQQTKRYKGPGAGEMFGIPFALLDAQIEFKLTALTRSELKGKLLLPFFDEYCDVVISINLDGSLSVRLSAEGGLITLTKPNLLKMKLDSISFEVVNGVFSIKLGGEVTPLFGAQQGNEWPSFRVDELSIDSHGNVRLAGGWLNLREKYTVKFQGFEVEVSKLGFGSTEDGGKWIGFTGGVKLVANMPAGASVEGLRITWYPDGRIEPSLNGVRVNFEVPNTLKFAGEVSYDKATKQFRGAVKLNLIALNMQVDATAVFGTTDQGKNYLAIYLAAEFPAGIPLFATGLGVYGVAGLFALNMEPNRAADQPWYALPPQPDWFHKAPVGVTALEKWKPVDGSLAFGAGVTLGTVADNGHTFSGKMLLAIVFPGPILILQGGASVLKERTKLDEEPNFRALAVLDGRAGTLSLGLDAQYRYDNNGNLIDIHGSAEGFFNFNDPNAWRLNVGQKDPRDRRLSARLFKLFDSYSYLMLNPQQLEMGAWVGFKQQWVFGPLSVNLEAWIDGNARVSWKPAHFYGDLWLHGSARLSAFGFGIGLTVDAKIAADVFDPLMILGQFNVAIDLPWPLSDIGVNIKLQWGPQPTPPPVPLPLKEVAIEHFKASTSWPLPRLAQGKTPALLLPNYDTNNDGMNDLAITVPAHNVPAGIPVVPLDSRPHVTFARNINDDALVGVNAQRVVPEFERIGDPVRNQGPARVRYGLEEVALEKQEGSNWKLVARKGLTPNDSSTATLYGSWAPVPNMPGGGGRNVGQTKLWLWAKTPFEYTRHTGRAWDEWFSDEYDNYPCGTLSNGGWDFENVEPQVDLAEPWHHPDELNLMISAGTMSIAALSRPSHGLSHAFAITGRGTADIMLPRPTNLIRILITESRFFRVSDFTGRDDGLGVFGAQLGGTDDRPYIEISGKNITRVHYFAEVHLPVKLADGVRAAIGGAYIPSLHKLVFVEFASGTIAAIDMLTGERSVIGSGYEQPEDIVVTAGGTVAYVTERVGSLVRVDLNNADRRNATLITKGMTAPSQIFLDEEGGQAWIVEHNQLGQGRLLSVTIDGPDTGTQTVFATGLDRAVGLVLSKDLGTAYVSEQGGGGKLTRINLVDGKRDIIATGLPEIFFLRWQNDREESIVSVRRDPVNHLIRFNIAKPTEDEPERIMDHLPFRPSSVVILPDDRWVVCSDQALTIFSHSLLVPKIVDVSGDVLTRHFEDEFARWSQVGEVLEPHTTYRLKIATRAKVFGEGQLRNYTKDAPATEFAYFRTAGPPGVTKLTAPAGSETEATPAEKYIGPLDTLSRYVRSTTPRELVPATASGPARLLYRAYDVGIEFNENYVDLMYRLGRRDLAIQMHDGNGAVRDEHGRRLVITNRWGRAEEVTLRESEERWLSVLGSGGCTLIPLSSITKDSTFSPSTEPHVLSASALCEARLVPATLHEDFASYAIGAGANGPSGSFDRWQVQDDAGSPASVWKIAKDETTSDRVLVQSNGGATSTIFIKSAPELGPDHPDQPANWTDYRLTVHLRSDAGRIGVVWRYQDAANHYRFVMDETGRREVFRVVGGVRSSLRSMTIPVTSQKAHVINVEVVGSTFRISEDGEWLMTIEDAATAKGGIGLFSSGNLKARFTDVAVDDFRSSAPVVYRFSFVTSRFKDFVDHLASYDKKIRLAQLSPSANVAPQIAAAAVISSPLGEAESRAYETLFAQLPNVERATSLVKVTRVEQNGSAIAFLVQSPEPLDWKRINLQLLHGPTFNQMPSKVLRKADGTGLFIVSPAATSAGSLLPPGDYRLVFTYRRDNRALDPDSEVFSEAGNSATEESTLQVPW